MICQHIGSSASKSRSSASPANILEVSATANLHIHDPSSHNDGSRLEELALGSDPDGRHGAHK
jgi:hypothetical protein